MHQSESRYVIAGSAGVLLVVPGCCFRRVLILYCRAFKLQTAFLFECKFFILLLII